MVLFNQDAGRVDATCNPGFPFPLGMLGQRFFASGDERTPIIAPMGYGYYVGSGANWNLIWDLAGMSRTPKTVYYQVTFNWVQAPAVNIDIKNDTTGQLICDSRAGYGGDPLYTDPEHGAAHISSMSTCVGTPVAKVSNGQRVTINAHYNMAKADPMQMGIVMAFVGAPRSSGPGTCVQAANSAHVTAGRATSFLIWAWAKGSNAYIGATWDTTSLKEGPTGTWTPC